MPLDHLTAETLICDESFQRYCTGEDSAAVQRWKHWIENHPECFAEVQEATRIVSMLNGGQGNVQEQLKQLEDGIRRFDHLKMAVKEEKRRPRRIKHPAVVAALFILLGSAAYLLFMPAQRPKHSLPDLAKNRVIHAGKEPRKTIILPDGSLITLRTNSSVEPSLQFNSTDREITLVGEAFFDIVRNTALPFIVHTRDADIEVTGTVFNVSAYAGSGETETTLIRGKVTVSPRNKPSQKMVLTPNTKIIIREDKVNAVRATPGLQIVPVTTNAVDRTASEIAWVRRRLKIEDEPLIDIASKLQDWYGIPVMFEDESVKKYRYSGTFESESIVKALEALQLSYPFQFRVEKERIIISR